MSPHLRNIVDRMPLTLPFVFLRSNGCGDIELHCDQMKVLLGGSILLDDSGNFELVLMGKLLCRCFEDHYSRGSDFFASSELIASLCASIIQYGKKRERELSTNCSRRIDIRSREIRLC